MSSPGAILLVEDNEDDVFVFQRALKKAGVLNSVHLVQDGQEVLDYLSGTGAFADRSKHPLPFIVFLDLKLPYRSGFDVLSWIKSQEKLRSVVVIVLTSSAEDKDHHRAYSLGARSYLVKPPTPDAVLDVAKSLCTYWASIGVADPFVIERSSD